MTGQIYPVKDIVAMARSRGIPVIVDGAHAFAQFPMSRDQMGSGLLRVLPPQVAARADWNWLPLRPEGKDKRPLAPDGGAGGDAPEHSEVRRDRNSSRCKPQRDF